MKFFNKKASSDLGPSKPRSFLRRIGRDPHVDWLLIIVVSFLFALLFSIFGVIKYLAHDNDASDQVPVSKVKDSNIVDTKVLDDVIGKYDERIEVRDQLIHGYSGSSDPSF